MLLPLLILIESCQKSPSIDISNAPLVPLPKLIEATQSSFTLNAQTKIYVVESEAENELDNLVTLVKNAIEPSTGFELEAAMSKSPQNGINLIIDPDNARGDESYELEVTNQQVRISSSGEAGLFYGLQTLLQLCPPEIAASKKQSKDWLIGTGKISDGPDFGYRGAMLDVARHFFSVKDVKKYIDHIAAYKLNMLHLHLSDDQGWRIEIKSWPELAKIGGQTQVGGGKGGYYTQEQYNDIVDYAAKRYITVIPEIDMPGHTNAALASYPELNCNNKATELYSGIEVGFSTLCVDKEITYQFIDDVIRELVSMTPGDYIHIGGDESHVTSMEEYIPFMNRVQDIVLSHGKKNIAWDEVAHADIREGTVAQFWAEEKNAKMVIEKGGKLLVSPAKRAYMDMQYDSTSTLGLHWAAYIEADDAYTWDPSTYVEGISKDDIIGVEAPLWSETIEKMNEIEYMIFPRVTAIAEIGWTTSDLRSWEGYSTRLAEHSNVWDVKGINFYRSKLIDWPTKTE